MLALSTKKFGKPVKLRRIIAVYKKNLQSTVAGNVLIINEAVSEP